MFNPWVWEESGCCVQWTPGVHAADPGGQRPPRQRGLGEGAGRLGDEDGGQRSTNLQSATASAKSKNIGCLVIFFFFFFFTLVYANGLSGQGVVCPPGEQETWGLNPGFMVFFFCAPQIYLWGSPVWVRFLCMWPFFFFVVTFHLRGWCMLGVFLLPAFTHLGHECQDLLSPCNGMHVCTD